MKSKCKLLKARITCKKKKDMKRAEKQQRMEAQDNEEEQPSPIERNEQVVHANERVLLLL